jgi:Mn2+/Fe2+ NRAMP family transporter
MSKLFARVGPGLMLAATAVGVSHLVWSTRAGAEYGFSLVGLITLIVILKYPAFRFAVDYASATGRSLVTGYSNISKIATAWLAVGFFFDTFIATSAVALVSAGLIISIFDLPFHGPQVAVALVVVTALVLLNGKYSKAEGIIKVLVILFSILVLTATILSLPLLGSNGREFFAELTPSRSLALFAIAVTGWMPMPTNGAALYATWICEKQRMEGEQFSYRQALADFRIGFGLAFVLALCFVVMGTAALFQTETPIPQNAGAFATSLLGIFTAVIGGWGYPLIAAAALAVMWSTLVALMDVLPRVWDRLTDVIAGRPVGSPSRYTKFLAIQVTGVAIVLLFLMGNFNAFLMLTTSLGFVAAPAVVYYNYRAVTSAEVPAEYRPSKTLVAWNWVAFVAMIGFALGFFYLIVT